MRKICLILHNPQKVNFFGKTVQDWLTGGKISSKLDYFQKYLREGRAVLYCDDYGTSLNIGPLRGSSYICNVIKRIEIYLWLLLNKINPLKVVIYFDSSKIKSGDILFSLTHSYLDNEAEASKALMHLECIKLLYLSHYMVNTSTVARNVNKVKSIIFIAENNLQKNSPYFKNNFPGYTKDVYVLPFSYSERFKKTSPFSGRKNKCLATGSFQTVNTTDSTFHDMYNFFNTDTFHPIRKEIYFNRGELTDFIDCYISFINEDTANALSEIVKPSGSFFSKIAITIKNYYLANVLGNYTRRAYYSFDIVRKYNDYKMFVVPEEIVDLPGIGFIEGMACGSAYIGIKSDMYRDIGLIEGIHYIGYENNLDSLCDTIKYYQTHNDELERIACNGHNFVIEHFRRETVAKKFFDDLEMAYTSGKSDALLQSSFVLR